MKDIRINKYLYLILIFAFLTIQIALANETFQNNLLKMSVHKDSLGGIRITLFTGKPYNEPITINKKSDYEYIILLPETSNSMTSTPALTSVSDTVKDISVKTQQYQNQVKGYTKIIIYTVKAAEITPQIQTLTTSDYKVSEKDYNELLSQINKKKPAVTQKAAMPAQKTLTAAPRPTQIPAIESFKTKIAPPIFTPKTVQKIIPEKKAAAKPAKPIQNIQKSTAPEKIAQQSLQNEVPQEVQQDTITKTSPDILTPKPEETITPPIKTAGRLQKYKTIIKNNAYAALGALVAIFLILIMGARKMTKNFKKQKEIFTSHLDEKPFATTDYSEKIDDSMTWKEKFQTYVETKENENKIPEISQEKAPQTSPELDDLFGSEEFGETFYEQPANEEVEMKENVFEENIEEQILTEEETFAPDDFEGLLEQNSEKISDESEFSIDELFGEDLEDLAKKTSEAETAEDEDNLVKSEFIIDDSKGFYLVDFEDTTSLVGHIEEEIFVIKRFDEKIDAPIQARLNERKTNSVNFMTKVGNFKGLVEVTPEEMNLLIEL